MVRTNQGGSILGFVIVGVVLALVLLGGAYFIRNNLSTSTDSTVVEDPEISEDDLGGDTSETDETSDQEAEDEGRTTIMPGVSVGDEEGTQADEFTDRTSQHDLPQTGASDVFAASLVLSVIAGSSAAYVRSRRASVSL